MSSAEFTDWLAYMSIEPHGYDLDTWRWGMMTANICNAVRSTIPLPKGKGKLRVFKAEDFYPFRKNEERTDLTAEQKAYLERKRKRRKKNG
jgi:hypothetical protein